MEGENTDNSSKNIPIVSWLKDLRKRKLLFILFLLCIILIMFWGIVYPDYGLITVYTFLIITIYALIWRQAAYSIRRHHRTHELGNIPGRPFEFLFLIFLFLATYLLYFINNPSFSLIINTLFPAFAVSAAYCGWLHYLEGFFETKGQPQSKIKSYWKTEYEEMSTWEYKIEGVIVGFFTALLVKISANYGFYFYISSFLFCVLLGVIYYFQLKEKNIESIKNMLIGAIITFIIVFGLLTIILFLVSYF